MSTYIFYHSAVIIARLFDYGNYIFVFQLRYLGEVINQKGERWEIQLKGSGLTPYSRSADGRKVLRSSIREFLCSEAMYYLSVPTTRAGTCVTSATEVSRDMFYDGHPKNEKCSVILRIAPTFLRFVT